MLLTARAKVERMKGFGVFAGKYRSIRNAGTNAGMAA